MNLAPREWTFWRRRRMSVAIRAAVMFIQGSDWLAINSELTSKKLIALPVSKARIAQYVKVGVEFLMREGCFIKTGKRRTSQK